MTGRLHGAAEVRQVLRYWHAALRYEEALASRPRARKPRGRAPKVNLLEPGNGQSYLRLGLEHAELVSLSAGSAQVIAELDEGGLQFFERWLKQEYQREAAEALGGERRESSFVAGFPSVFFTSREELATIFRFPVEVAFLAGSGPWKPPSYRARREGKTPGLPDRVVVSAAPWEPREEQLPFSVDVQLLGRVLGISEEKLSELTARWKREPPTPRVMIGDVLRLLGAAPARGASFMDLLTALAGAARTVAAPGVSVYPNPIVYDGSLSFATFHVQRELESLSDDLRCPSLQPETPLNAYLTGEPAPRGWAQLRGRFRERGLSPRQREVAEAFLGSTLAAVQGPPGTGKTELISSLGAHVVVERASALAKDEGAVTSLLVVTSTNNRAVDNVIDPLSVELPAERLPLALRAGNRDVTAAATADGLGRAIAWLQAQDDSDAEARLGAALEAFRAAERAFDAATAPEVLARTGAARQSELQRALEALGPKTPEERSDPEIERALFDLATAAEDLQRLHDDGGKKLLSRLHLRWARAADGPLADAKARDPELAARLAEGLPPERPFNTPRELLLEAWEEAIGDFGFRLRDEAEPFAMARRRASLLSELEVLTLAAEAPGAIAPHEEVEALAYRLYLAALEVRERWAVKHRAPLLEALKAARDAAVELRSLKRLFAKEAEVERWIRRLYPLMGCTLLSLGNSFEPELGSIDRLVIDEAGQCHPAYAVSGLARATQALVIGDVHQLPPVVQLGPGDEARIRASAGVTVEPERFAPFAIDDRAGSSAQALADRAVEERLSLIDHFRCHPEIIALSDALCGYGLVTHTSPRLLPAAAAVLGRAAVFGDVDGAQIPVRGSWANEAEAMALVELLLSLAAAGVAWEDVAVLTPYVGQLELLKRRLDAHRIPHDIDGRLLELPLLGETMNARGLATGTVHRFQGGERPIVLLSTVVTEAKSLSFLDERENLLNVAISRARNHLVVLGDRRTLAMGRRTRILVERTAPLERLRRVG